MKDNVSPEEKLLRLIRGPKKPTPTTSGATLKPKSKVSLRFSLSDILPKINAPKVILIIFILSCIYLVMSLAYPWFGLKEIRLPKAAPGKVAEDKLSVKREAGKPLEFYEEGIANKQLFANSAAQEGAKPASALNADLIKDINLVGIITGVNPQAVIEDKKSAKTYYVTKGQFFGEMQVYDIQEGKIIINYRGQKYELYL